MKESDWSGQTIFFYHLLKQCMMMWTYSHRWWWQARCPVLHKVKTKKAKAGRVLFIIANPNHSKISPKKFAPDTYSNIPPVSKKWTTRKQLILMLVEGCYDDPFLTLQPIQISPKHISLSHQIILNYGMLQAHTHTHTKYMYRHPHFLWDGSFLGHADDTKLCFIPCCCLLTCS